MTEWESMRPLIAIWDGIRIGAGFAICITCGVICTHLPRLVRAMERIVALAEKE